MGRDGAAGAAAVHRAGGPVIAQDEPSTAALDAKAAIEQGADLVLRPAGHRGHAGPPGSPAAARGGSGLTAAGGPACRATSGGRARPAMKGSLGQVARLVSETIRIALPTARADALRTALRRAAPGARPAPFPRAVADPAQRAQSLSRRIDEVTVQETCFARDVAQSGSFPGPGRAGRARSGPA